VKLELGVGNVPHDGYLRHDRTKHSDWVDVTHDLESLPWPWEDGEFEEVRAIDVLEHLRMEVHEWLGECWRIIQPGGLLTMRLPAWDNPVSYRDPTHHRVFHSESFDYWDPDLGLWQEFGRDYPGSELGRWWQVERVGRDSDEHSFDWLYALRKRPLE